MDEGRRNGDIPHTYQQLDPDRLHHQNVYHRLISLALQKPRKADYSNPRARGLVHLSMMGEWIEKVIATRLYYATKPRLTPPPNQFGAMPVKSTTDAALRLAQDIHSANTHNLFTSLITFDITGYSDNVTGYWRYCGTRLYSYQYANGCNRS